jgi:Flp pilus assembly pilin Flp
MLQELFVKFQVMVGAFRSRFEDESGAVATEYVLLLVLIALAITGGMIYLATQINQKFSDAGDTLTGI